MNFPARLTALMLSAALLSGVRGAVAERTSAPEEFPALQLLPPGSIVRGISLPRYENHRVTSLLTADMMEVLSRYEARMENIQTLLYGESGDITRVRMANAHYNFRTQLLTSRNNIVTLVHPRYNVRAHGGILHNGTRRGVLTGPVNTVIRSANLAAP